MAKTDRNCRGRPLGGSEDAAGRGCPDGQTDGRRLPGGRLPSPASQGVPRAAVPGRLTELSADRVPQPRKARIGQVTRKLISRGKGVLFHTCCGHWSGGVRAWGPHAQSEAPRRRPLDTATPEGLQSDTEVSGVSTCLALFGRPRAGWGELRRHRHRGVRPGFGRVGGLRRITGSLLLRVPGCK